MAKCKGCGKEIVWALDENNHKIPLDLTPPVYMLLEKLSDGTHRVRRDKSSAVTHFATCRRANDFSRKKCGICGKEMSYRGDHLCNMDDARKLEEKRVKEKQEKEAEFGPAPKMTIRCDCCKKEVEGTFWGDKLPFCEKCKIEMRLVKVAHV